MLAIKLSRVGKKKQPSYRVVVTEKARDPWGNNTEIVGFYDPLANPKVIRFEADRIKYWMSEGAQPTDTVHNLLVNAGVIEGEKRKAHPTHKLSAEELAELEEKKKKEAAAAKAKEEATKLVPAVEPGAAAEAPAEEVKEEAKAEEKVEEATPAAEAAAEAPAEEKKEEATTEEPKTE